MIKSARFINVDGYTIELNDLIYPWKSFTTEVDVRTTEKEKMQANGIWPAATYLGKRLFHADGQILANTSAEYMQRRLALIRCVTPRPELGYKMTGTLQIEFEGIDETLSSECTIDGWPEIPMDGLSPSISSYQINWKAFVPPMFGLQRTSVITYATSIVGRTYNKTYPKTYAGTGEINDILIVNSGNAETFPVVRIYGPATTPQITNTLSTGEIRFIRLEGIVLGASEYVDIDMAAHSATRYDGANLYYSANGEWWNLQPPPVTNTVRLTGTLSLGARAEINWRNAYNI